MNLQDELDKLKETVHNEQIYCTRIAHLHTLSKDTIKALKIVIKEKEDRLKEDIKS